MKEGKNQMRTDATIDKRQVRCPNASTLGFGKWKAQVGDFILFKEGDRQVCGRVIGRVHYAPPCGESPAVRDSVLTICLGDHQNFTMERWVKPEDVLYIESMDGEQGEKRRAVMAWFLSDEIVQAPIEEVRKSTTDRWSTLAAYRQWRQKLNADIADLKSRP
jgi:hypothetical protein